MELINHKYKIIEKIGEGNFGTIYKGENIRTRELVAIKVEPIEKDIKLLKNESIIYQYLTNVHGIPSVKWFGKDTTNYYMVLNLLGPSLQTIKNNQLNSFSLKLVLQIGIKVVLLLKTIHEKKLVHRDVKPDNFLFGLNNENNDIYIIDFGFCKTFMDGDCHIEETKTSNIIGSITYASINSHKCIELSRRDDLESLGYMLVYLYLGYLPWQELSHSISQIQHMKETLIETISLPRALSEFIHYVRSVEFKEEPQYKTYCDMFLREIETIQKRS